STEIDYVRTSETPPMSGRILLESAYRGADVGCSPYSTFGNRGRKRQNLFVTFARRLSADLSAMVKWFGFFIIIRFFLFKFTKNPPLDQIYIPLI
ncbi:MAG: hypothetical protein PUG32_06465, partial [Bacteroidales bacterium]|nr:hypothetical protein [Bacteroidales bacterium]